MTNNKNNNVPIHEEQQFIQQKIKIPSNFIELKTTGKNYICSTQGWPKEPVCERYGFLANGKWVQLDISHELMENRENTMFILLKDMHQWKSTPKTEYMGIEWQER